MRKKITVIIPAYNAERKISTVIKRLSLIKDEFDQLIIVNDGSIDDTRNKIFTELPKLNKSVQFFSHKISYGYGGAQKTLFKHFLNGPGDIAVLLHADDQYPTNRITDIVKPILENTADIVLGSRFKEKFKRSGMPVHKLIGNRILTLFENIVLGSNLSEFHTGFRAYSRKVLETINFPSYSNYYDFDSQILFDCILKGFRIDEISIKTKYSDEISYLNPFKYGIRILKIIFSHLINK